MEPGRQTNRPGRPKLEAGSQMELIAFRIRKLELGKLDRYCKKSKQTRSEAIRACISKGIR